MSIPQDRADAARGALLMAGLAGWEEIEDGSEVRLVLHLPRFEDGEAGAEASIGPLAVSRALAKVSDGGIVPSVQHTLVDDEDWAHSWKRFWKPMRIGRLFAVVPSWETYEPEPGERIIELDPGMAFGTGTHETTKMCLEWLERVMRSGDRVLDVGTGSGILTIGALLMGASKVVAVDNDPIATTTARENLQRNGLEADVRDGNGLDVVTSDDLPFDLIVANIVADVLISLVPELPALLRRGGHFVGSGIIQERVDDVDRALETSGFTERHWERQGEWASVAARVGQ